MESIYQRVKMKIDRNDLVILDGGVGTELQFRGIEMDETWCGSASLNTQVLEQVHLDYIKAGAEIITTNTYASSRLMLEAGDLGDNFEEINLKAIYAAQEAKRKTSIAPKIIQDNRYNEFISYFPHSETSDQEKAEKDILLSLIHI